MEILLRHNQIGKTGVFKCQWNCEDDDTIRRALEAVRIVMANEDDAEGVRRGQKNIFTAPCMYLQIVNQEVSTSCK